MTSFASVSYTHLYIGGVAGTRPGFDLFRHQFLVGSQFPGEKAFSGVSGPERAVAVKGGYLGFQVEYIFHELDLTGCEVGHEMLGLG